MSVKVYTYAQHEVSAADNRTLSSLTANKSMLAMMSQITVHPQTVDNTDDGKTVKSNEYVNLTQQHNTKATVAPRMHTPAGGGLQV